MKSYAIGHFIDVDGISSQAVIGRANARRGIEPVHIDITYKDPVAALRQATPEKGEIVRLFDFGYSKVLETPEALEEFGRITCTGDLEIYDHHNGWPRESRVYRFARRIVVPREGDDLGTRCTAQILHWFFGRKDNVLEMLSYIANASDFGDNTQYKEFRDYTIQLEQALRGANNSVTQLTPLNIIDWFKSLQVHEQLTPEELLKSEFWPNSFAESATIYQRVTERARMDVKDTARLVKLRAQQEDIQVVIGFGDKILYMKDGVLSLIESNPGIQIYACVHSDGSVIFSRGTGDIDVSRLGRSFGGGGRELWSGGYIPEEWGGEDREVLLERMKERIEQTLANIS